MTAKEWLSRVRRMDAEINALILARQDAFTQACGTSAGGRDDKVQTSRRNTSEDIFIKYADYTRLIDRRIDELYAVKQEVMTAVSKLEDGVLRTLLIEYYINGKTWEQVAEDMNYSRMQIHRLHNKAIDVMECYI